jgi:non-canonical purine NTP pyrophosphatase (RdgB/HAM1 family)
VIYLKERKRGEADRVKTIVIATRNPHKVDEYRAMFQPFGFSVTSLLDHPEIPDVEETGATFAENALLKARAVVAALGVAAVADDSGLEVVALGGLPGVRSQRYSEEGTATANNAKLLAALADVDDRRARFVCTIAVARTDGSHRLYRGTLEGFIVRVPSGTNGFGYDPLFQIAGEERTVAMLPAAEKNAVSHRGRAFRELIADAGWWNR